MNSNDYSKPIMDIGDSAKECLDTKVDEIKLKLVKNLSSILSTFLSILLTTFLFVIALSFLGEAMGRWLGTFFSNPATGFLIIGGVFVLLCIIMLFCGKNIFTNNFIRKFINILFSDDDE